MIETDLQPRTHALRVTMTNEERLAIAERAQLTGERVEDYVRRRALGDPPPKPAA